MRKQVLAPERVTFLLTMVAYLRDVGSASVAEIAERFAVPPELVRTLVRFLGTAGVPGETLSYQDEDLFDIDWDALDQHDVVSLTRTVGVDETPRFAPLETAALIAGLQALTGMLSPEDAELARATAAKLGAALGAAPTAPVSVTDVQDDARLPELVSAIEAERTVTFVYRDASGTDSQRTVRPHSLTQGAGTWYLRGYCEDRRADRTFRVDQMSEVRVRDLSGADESLHESYPPANTSTFDEPYRNASEGIDIADTAAIVALVTEAALPQLAGFAPEVLDEAQDGRVRVRVDAWHAGTAVQLVQVVPGDVEIESPEAARAAVRQWSERALSAYGA
ncbi:helix-turn-helix transcriptional regulator [Leucobacter sp. NPDC058333]|uniref:helix-turn-helix transcriptional regulator n=1 Tax=Leucobacter sp. NPDC058333 TaxID=3346450 RepID=UPI00364A4337